MWDVKPGDLVVCVDDAPSKLPARCRSITSLCPLSSGQIYVVRKVGTTSKRYVHGSGIPSIWLEEIVRPVTFRDEGEPGYRLDRFRPVSKTNTELFRNLVAPVPTRQKERV